MLISSSENAIRGLLMHLCQIPADRIVELEIPTGVPIVFDLDAQVAMRELHTQPAGGRETRSWLRGEGGWMQR